MTTICLLFLLSFTTFLFAEENKNTVITVNGNAMMKAEADVAYITVYVKDEGKKLSEAMKRATDKAETIKKVLLQKYPQIKGIIINTYKIGEKHKLYQRPGIDLVPSDPEVFKQIWITVEPDPICIENIVDDAIENDAYIELPKNIYFQRNAPEVVVYGLSMSSIIEDQVITKAIEDVNQKAERVAKTLGKKCGSIQSLYITYDSKNPTRRYFYGNLMLCPAEYTSKDKDSIVIECSVTAQYEITE